MKKGWNHGTRFGYVRHSCRCAECVAAERDYQKARNRTVKPHQHGTTTGYRYGCRCELCSEANREAVAKTNAARTNQVIRQFNSTRRARVAGAFIETVCPTDVFTDDNWVCHICSGEVDPNLKWPNPFSASLDHVIPLARGGLHERCNLATAHLRCNQSKGTRQIERDTP